MVMRAVVRRDSTHFRSVRAGRPGAPDPTAADRRTLPLHAGPGSFRAGTSTVRAGPGPSEPDPASRPLP